MGLGKEVKFAMGRAENQIFYLNNHILIRKVYCLALSLAFEMKEVSGLGSSTNNSLSSLAGMPYDALLWRYR